RLREAMESDRQVPVFLPEASAELAFAGLAKRLETEVERASPGNAGCAITTRTPIDAGRNSNERFERVGVHVRLRCGNAETVALLHALEGGSPRLFVDNLSVVAQGFFERPGGAGRGDSGLDVEFDLHGHLAPASLRGATGVAHAPCRHAPRAGPAVDPRACSGGRRSRARLGTDARRCRLSRA